MKTFSLKPAQIERQWHLIDAKDQVLGRLASKIAVILMGKNKPEYTAHVEMGDHVVVINSRLIATTGKKSEQKVYRHHSGYPGGMKVTTFKVMHQTNPGHIIKHAVEGMLPKNKLQDRMLKHLHIYPTDVHPYGRQFKKST